MITIHLSPTDHRFAATVRKFCASEMQRNPNLNGARITIEPGDHTYVDGADELVGASLLAGVCGAVQDARERAGEDR